MKLITAPFVISLLLTLMISTDGKAGCTGYINCYDSTSGDLVGSYADTSIKCSWDFQCQVASRSNVPARDCNRNIPECHGNCSQGMAVCSWKWD